MVKSRRSPDPYRSRLTLTPRIRPPLPLRTCPRKMEMINRDKAPPAITRALAGTLATALAGRPPPSLWVRRKRGPATNATMVRPSIPNLPLSVAYIVTVLPLLRHLTRGLACGPTMEDVEHLWRITVDQESQEETSPPNESTSLKWAFFPREGRN